MKLEINLSDITLLIKVIEDPVLVDKLKGSEPILAKEKYQTGKYLIELSKNEIDSVIDSLCDYFITSGLDDEDEPNSLGIQIESLIDVFYREK